VRLVHVITFLLSSGLAACLLSCTAAEQMDSIHRSPRPNFIIITTDDQRYDAMGCAGNTAIHTPHIDSLAARGRCFTNSFVTLSICSPSRAACLTGRYGSVNGVMQLGRPLNRGEKTFAHYLKQAGYHTGFVGKWHVGQQTPDQCGFDWSAYFEANGPQFDRTVLEHGQRVKAEGFIEDYNAALAIRFLKNHAQHEEPFLLWLCTQVPHMTPDRDWPSRPETLDRYDQSQMPVPASWSDDLAGKPTYLLNARSRIQGVEDGLASPEGIRRNSKRYYAAITDLDVALGRVFEAIDQLNLRDNTYVVFTSDNGWFLGEHGFTSKVLAYEESIRVPLIITGPRIRPGQSEHMTLNIDIAPTLLDLADLDVPSGMQGCSLKPLLKNLPIQWRKDFLYEATLPQLGSQPVMAVRTEKWKYIRTYETADLSILRFEELYDLETDPGEMKNVVADPRYATTRQRLAERIAQLRKETHK
jgi:arylsulfatase A-like enzyme